MYEWQIIYKNGKVELKKKNLKKFERKSNTQEHINTRIKAHTHTQTYTLVRNKQILIHAFVQLSKVFFFIYITFLATFLPLFFVKKFFKKIVFYLNSFIFLRHVIYAFVIISLCKNKHLYDLGNLLIFLIHILQTV